MTFIIKEVIFRSERHANTCWSWSYEEGSWLVKFFPSAGKWESSVASVYLGLVSLRFTLKLNENTERFKRHNSSSSLSMDVIMCFGLNILPDRIDRPFGNVTRLFLSKIYQTVNDASLGCQFIIFFFLIWNYFFSVGWWFLFADCTSCCDWILKWFAWIKS